ncbi:MAG: hypothetical protein ACTSYC_07460 [Promethearchaeota archaeon]
MNVKKLKEWPNTKLLFVLTIIGFIIFILINQLVFAPLSATYTSYGILEFEFAWTRGRVISIFTMWGQQGMLDQKLGVYWDFLYIISYILFIMGCIILITRHLEGKIENLGYKISLLIPLSGIFDVIENINLLIMLEKPTTFSSLIPFLASICATIKFTLLIIGIVYFIIALILFIYNVAKKKMK